MLKTLALGLLGLGLAAGAAAADRPGVAPDAAWHMLVLGNDRFVSGLPVAPHLDADTRRELLVRQRPWAVVVSDADSRVVPEFIFDLGLGDLYDVRTAASQLGSGPSLDSVAYAVEHLGPRLVAVIGHSHDPLVRAALDGDKDGAAGRLAAGMTPAVEQARDKVGGLSGQALADEVVERNVLLQVERILKVPSVRDLVRSGRVKVIGGVYDLDSGHVRWLGEHPEQGQILAGQRP